jgi:hypothetical protein
MPEQGKDESVYTIFIRNPERTKLQVIKISIVGRMPFVLGGNMWTRLT